MPTTDASAPRIAASPPDEPPGVRSGSNGCIVRPYERVLGLVRTTRTPACSSSRARPPRPTAGGGRRSRPRRARGPRRAERSRRCGEPGGGERVLERHGEAEERPLLAASAHLVGASAAASACAVVARDDGVQRVGSPRRRDRGSARRARGWTAPTTVDGAATRSRTVGRRPRRGQRPRSAWNERIANPIHSAAFHDGYSERIPASSSATAASASRPSSTACRVRSRTSSRYSRVAVISSGPATSP